MEENFDFIKSLVPKTYPRAVEEKDDYLNEISFYVSVIFSLTSFAFVLVALIGTIVKRSKRAIVYAQRDFLFFLLAGLTMVSVASIILNIPPSDASCMAKDWLVIQGYTFELVPLILKVAAIAQLVAAAAKFKRVQLEKGKLYGAVFTMSLLVFIFLILWTVIDPTIKRTDFRLTEDTTDVGDTIVMRSYYCHSDSDTWLFISTGWHGILLLAATVLAVQTRKLRRDINESGVIAVLVYSHAIFVVLRMLLYYFSDKFTVWNLVRYQSLIFSIDVIAACSIYFFPKIFLEEQQANNFMSSLPGMSVFPGFRSGRSNQFSASNTPVKGSATTAGKESFERKNGDSGGDNHDNDHHGDETGHPEAFENVSFFEDSDQDHAGRDLECFKEALKDEGLWSEKSSKSCSFGIVSGSGELNGTDGSQTLLHKFDDDGDRPNIDSSDQTEHTRGGRRSRRSGRKATTCGSKRKISPSDIKNRRASTGSSLNGPSPFVDEIYENEVELQ